ncbi:MAG: hypothetical protein RLZZ241_859 [Bacteroidota bacterium]|jgi:GNAT superfamily N-acetyltransferase
MPNQNSPILLRPATSKDATTIWVIIQQAIAQRKRDGSEQWQNGYPSETTVLEDINKGYGYVLEDNRGVLAYAAILFENEPAYEEITGAWVSNGPYTVVHRVATADAFKGQGIGLMLMEKIEQLSLSRRIFSIKVDTNFDNIPMLKILDRLQYTYCGEVFFCGDMRKAYEKVLH